MGFENFGKHVEGGVWHVRLPIVYTVQTAWDFGPRSSGAA